MADTNSKPTITEDQVNDAFGADDSVAAMQSLLSSGLDPNTHFGYNGTPMTMAVEADELPLVKLMLSSGGDVNQAASIDHKPSLWFAVCNENPEMVKFLLDNGAKLQGSGALHQAVCIQGSQLALWAPLIGYEP